MAVLSNYTQLQSAVANWLNRDDLTDRIPEFIRLAEAAIDRTLRRSTTRASITISGESTELGAGVAELRSVRLVTSSRSLDVALEVVTPEMLADHRANLPATGRPAVAAVLNGNLIVAPAPGGAYTAEIVYFNALVPLSDTNPTNVVLTEAPDLYLYGSLMHSAPFLEHDERLQTWTALFESALEQLHLRREREEHGANMRPIRLPVVFGARP